MSTRWISLQDVVAQREIAVIDEGSRLNDSSSHGLQSYGIHYNRPAVFSPDGSLIAAVGAYELANGRAASSAPRAVRIWSVETRKVVSEFAVPDGRYTALDISPDNRLVALSGADSVSATLWEIASGSLRESLSIGLNRVELVRFLPNGRGVVFCGERYLSLIDPSDPTRWRPLMVNPHRNEITAIAVGADNKTLATGSIDQSATTCCVPAIPTHVPDALTLTPEQATALWDHLSGSTGQRSYRATLRLAKSPGPTLTLIRQNVLQPMDQDSIRFAQLIGQLGAEDFQTREQAMRQLRLAGKVAHPALRSAQSSTNDAEVGDRIKQLLNEPQANGFDGGRVRIGRVAELLELIGGNDAQTLAQQIAAKTSDDSIKSEFASAILRMGTP